MRQSIAAGPAAATARATIVPTIIDLVRGTVSRTSRDRQCQKDRQQQSREIFHGNLRYLVPRRGPRSPEHETSRSGDPDSTIGDPCGLRVEESAQRDSPSELGRNGDRIPVIPRETIPYPFKALRVEQPRPHREGFFFSGAVYRGVMVAPGGA